LVLLPLSALAEDMTVPTPHLISEAEILRLPPIDPASDCDQGVQATCCSPWLTWTARAGLVALRRSGPDSAVLIQDQSIEPQTLNASAFDFDFELGWDVTLIGHIGGLPEVEIRHLSVDGWTAPASQEMLAGPIEIQAAVPIFVNATGTVAAQHGSDLHSSEINARWPCTDRVTLLAGFRYLELDEQFHADVPSNVAFDWRTRNRLYGGQIGAEASLWEHRCLTIEGTARLGLFGNAAAQDGYLRTGRVTVADTASCDGTSYLVEAGLTVLYQLTPKLALRGAYNVLWLGDVALATDQVALTGFVVESSVDDDGDVFYHGAFLGFEFRR
jgi:hypothetical protein